MSEFIEDQFYYNVEELPEMLLVKYSFEPDGDGWTNLSFDIFLGDIRMNRFLEQHAFPLMIDIEKEIESRCDRDMQLHIDDEHYTKMDAFIEANK